MKKLKKYLQESYEELKKVAWPTKEVTRRHTILVIAISLFIGIYFAAVDYILNLGLESII